MTNKAKQRIKNYYLITQGLIIQEVVIFAGFTLLYPHGAIYTDQPYRDQILGLEDERFSLIYVSETTRRKLKKKFKHLPEHFSQRWIYDALEDLGVTVVTIPHID